MPQATNPFGQFQQLQQQQQLPAPQLQSQFTGAGFGGYSTQPQQYGFENQQTSSMFDGLSGPTYQPQFPQYTHPQQQPQQQIATQATNPFRQSQQGPVSPIAEQMTGKNPFAQSNIMQNQQQNMPHMPQTIPFNQADQQMQASQQPPMLQPLFSQPTGTNPFARGKPSNAFPQQAASPTSPSFGTVVSHTTGSTNPFRQSAFVNQQTGQGWQSGPQGTMGGLEQLPTIPIFPRPGQSQYQQQQSPWGL